MKKLFDGITPITAIFFLILTALGFGAKIHQRHHDRKKRNNYEKKLEKQQRKDQERYKALQTQQSQQSQHQLKEPHIPENNTDFTDENPKEGTTNLTIENLFIYPTINDSSQQMYTPKEEPIQRPDPPSEPPPKENATLPKDNRYPLGADRNPREKKNQ